ncbi:50S ribosomal protein L24 [Candidatus Neptunichlamydia sp. REUL1]|uniref:50S ribosomal protein L24 n=1 Tax=Candidatus Neptunichlamydia sp. REUL1 TaxID=3064277 RepID=UPI002931C370|nr:50S ribosomal protein L24 [Candidatus Neptunochlamydia sp. REUL1]
MKQKWIKIGDKVLVLNGNDRGKVGEVLAKKDSRILVQGVNVRKRHTKARQQGQKSEIVSLEKSIHISNVALCDGDGKKIKLNVKMGKDGSKELVYINDGKEVSHRTLKKPVKA